MKKMVKITAKAIRKRVRNLKRIITRYKKNHPKKDRNYAEYEREFKRRLKKAIKNLEKLISESIRGMDIFYRHKDRHSLSLRKRIRLILVKELTEKGNRKTANTLELFSMLGWTDISYKTIERLYSDELLQLALFNLLILILKKRGIKEIDTCGDATGYSLVISKHYSSYVQKLKDKSKEQNFTRKLFIYNFALMDLETKMYVCFGSSLRSEKEAFDKAMQMLQIIDVKIKSIRLDRYYSCPVYVNQFKDSKVYIIPKKKINLQHGAKWTETMGDFLFNTTKYLGEYFKRNNSESGWASDKKMFGWKVSQKRYDRMDMALFVRMIWHNLILLYK